MSGTLAVLRAARDLLTPPGAWIQGRYANDDLTCFCLLGALGMADKGRPTDPYFPVKDAIESHLPACEGHISVWNDEPGRTQADVLALLDRAIAAQGGRA
jgi:hypothetical protein